MKIQRYNTVVNMYDQISVLEDIDGEWVLYKDVEVILKELEEVKQELENMKEQEITDDEDRYIEELNL